MHNAFSKASLVVTLASIVGTSALATVASLPPQPVAAGQKTLAEIARQDRIAFAREYGCKDPEGITAATEDSPIADLLISLSIEESGCDKEAIGAVGEEGGFQVIAKHWGRVPKDLAGQAKQAEIIISRWTRASGGDFRQALANYNGGIEPPPVSYQYADRILKRQAALTKRRLQSLEQALGQSSKRSTTCPIET